MSKSRNVIESVNYILLWNVITATCIKIVVTLTKKQFEKLGNAIRNQLGDHLPIRMIGTTQSGK